MSVVSEISSDAGFVDLFSIIRSTELQPMLLGRTTV